MYLDKVKLNGRSALVTGGGRAIGLACVEALAEAGARVIIADVDPAVAAEGQKAMKAKGGSWPSQEDVIQAMIGLEIESLGGKGTWRKDKIADQTFVQGFTTHKNSYDFVTLAEPFDTMYSADLQKPPGANFWEWIKTAQFKI